MATNRVLMRFVVLFDVVALAVQSATPTQDQAGAFPLALGTLQPFTKPLLGFRASD